MAVTSLPSSGPLDCLLQTDSAEHHPRWPLSLHTGRKNDNRDLAMISLDLNFNILTRDLSHYLENQVKVGLFGSGVGLSLVLGFSAAYTCYYLLSVAKVSAAKCAFNEIRGLIYDVYIKVVSCQASFADTSIDRRAPVLLVERMMLLLLHM